MERDFLGMNGNDSGSIVKEEGRGSRQDSAYLGGSAVQWPFSNKISALQQFMSYRAGQDERSKKLVFDHLSSSVFQPIATVDSFEANSKSSPVQAQQKCFNFDRQGGVHQFPIHAYQSQSMGSSDAPTHHLNEAKAVPSSSSFFKIHGSSYGPNFTVTSLKQQPSGGGIASGAPSVGSFAPRNSSKPSATTAQLTIFYAGSVNVYDDVPLDKAQAIMFLASKGASAPLNAVNPRPEALVSAPTKVAGVDSLNTKQTQLLTPTPTPTPTPNHTASPCSGVSSTISATSHTGAHSGSGCSTTDDMAVAKGVVELAPTSAIAKGVVALAPVSAIAKGAVLLAPTGQHEPSKNPTAPTGSAAPTSVMPRAIPQARKASLARFLEKRKERVTIAAPYSIAKKPSENDAGLHNPSSKPSSTDITPSSGREELWNFGCQPNNSTESGEYPSTKLMM